MSGDGPILLVDDDEDLLTMIAMVLESAGLPVVLAHNGADALRVASSLPSRPRLILLDLMMPIMDGWEFRARQLEDDLLRDVPVIVFSGDGNVEAKGGRLGVAASLKKPFDAATLIAAVERVSRAGA